MLCLNGDGMNVEALIVPPLSNFVTVCLALPRFLLIRPLEYLQEPCHYSTCCLPFVTLLITVLFLEVEELLKIQ